MHNFLTSLDDALATLLLPSGAVSMAGMPRMDRAFYPGGNGMWAVPAATALPTGGSSWAIASVLVLGSNFGSSANFQRGGQLTHRDEMSDPRNPTWRGIRTQFRAAEINLNRCFFTNAWPCLHEGEST